MYIYKHTYVGMFEDVSITYKDRNGETHSCHWDNHWDSEYPHITDYKETVGYWRKSYAIHTWFENNLANGELDNCREYDISIEQIKELLDTCKVISEHHNLADKLLPYINCTGISTYSDEDFEDIESTIRQLETLIKNYKEGDEFTYYASW